MFSKFFGSKKKESPEDMIPPDTDFSFLVTDMHSHLIPGIDDGSPTMEDSLELVRGFQALGFKSLITTPHIKIDHYPNTTEIIQSGLRALQAALKEAEIDMPVQAAAEYFVDDHFMHLLDAGDLMTLRGKEVLIEFSFFMEPVRMHDTLFRIQTKGFKPVVAHPERYEYYHPNFSAYEEFKTRGCLLQLNTLSVTGYYGKGVQDIALQMLEKGLYDYCGSDTHHLRHIEGLEKMKGTKALAPLLRYPFRNPSLLG